MHAPIIDVHKCRIRRSSESDHGKIRWHIDQQSHQLQKRDVGTQLIRRRDVIITKSMHLKYSTHDDIKNILIFWGLVQFQIIWLKNRNRTKPQKHSRLPAIRDRPQKHIMQRFELLQNSDQIPNRVIYLMSPMRSDFDTIFRKRECLLKTLHDD